MLVGASAGGGSRTPTLFRAPAPKAGVSSVPPRPRWDPILVAPFRSSRTSDTVRKPQTYVRQRLEWAMRSRAEVEDVQQLVADGFNDCQVARRTGIPRSTVREWRVKQPWLKEPKQRRHPRSRSSYQCREIHDFSELPGATYSYLLGMYLGDGCISAAPRGVWRLRVSMDASYPGIIDECCAAMEGLVPTNRAYRLVYRDSRCVEVSMSSKHWPCLIPQHGPGRKHHRRLWLADWQEQMVDRHRENFIRGLIHSDGDAHYRHRAQGFLHSPGTSLCVPESLRGHPETLLRELHGPRRPLDTAEFHADCDLSARLVGPKY
jgi:hypothetical protein